MHNIKKIALFSLMGNVLLLIIYIIFFQHHQHFKDDKGMVQVLAFANEDMDIAGATIIKAIQSILNKKPKLKIPMNAYFEDLEKITTSFHQHISTLSPEEALAQFEIIQTRLVERYAQGVEACKKEAKLKNKEVEEKIERYRAVINFSILPNDTLLILEDTLLQQILIHHIQQSELLGIHDFARLVGGRSSPLNRYFPVLVAPLPSGVRLGEPLQLKIGIGAYSSQVKGRIFVEGKEVELNTEMRAKIKLRAPHKAGKKRIELVVEWTHPNTLKIDRDTSYYDYWVVN